VIVGDTIKIGYYTQSGQSKDNALLTLLKNTENLFRFLKGRMISASQLLERFYLMPKNSMIM
jgi:ATP-binding cassette subfamily F protein uup